MASKIIEIVEGSAMPFGEDDVDTDIIAPSRFLLTTTWAGVGEGLLFPRRYSMDGKINPESSLNNPAYQGARILFAGKNFGCGSSREHAPQAIKANYDAVVAVSFAGIFDGNCYAIGLPAVKVQPDAMFDLLSRVKADPRMKFRLNLRDSSLRFYDPAQSDFGGYAFCPIQIDEVKRKGFLEGTWDVRQELVDQLPRTREVAASLPYLKGFTA